MTRSRSIGPVWFIPLCALLLLPSRGQVQELSGSGGGMPAIVQGVKISDICSRLRVDCRSIRGYDGTDWIAIDDDGQIDRVRAELHRMLSSGAQGTLTPEPRSDGGAAVDAANHADVTQKLAQKIAELITRRDYSGVARLYMEAIPGVKREYGPNHWMVASYLTSAATYFEKAGMGAEVEQCLLQAVSAAERSGDPESISIHRRNLADFYKSREDARVRQEEAQRKRETEKRAQAIEQLRGSLKPLVTGAAVVTFSPVAEFKPIGQDYPAPKTSWEQALCAAFLSDMARQAASAEDARFYSDQAESVMAGGSIHVKWNPPRLSLAQERKLEELGRKIAEITGDIQLSAPRRIQMKEIARTAETQKSEMARKWDASKQKVETARKTAREVPPEQKKEADDLLALAEQELQAAEMQMDAAEQALNAAKLEALNLSEQQEKREGEIRKLQEQMREESQRGES